MNDPLSDTLRLIRLRSCVYFQRDFYAPWGMRIENTGFAQFHVVTRGNCIVEENGHIHDCSVGDVLFFPHSAAHTLADARGRQAVSGPDVMSSFAGDDPLFGDGETYTRIICGHFEFRADLAHPILTDLPEFIHLRSLDMPQDAGMSSVLSLLMGELSQAATGCQSIIERCAEILIIQTLRIYAAQNPNLSGFITILSDKRLSRAVQRIHRDFASSLGLKDLAREAALSRSAFALRFKEMVGIAPIEYLAKWRMLIAGDLLKITDLSVSQVSEQVGYVSDISFARAFKREFGVTPSQFRRHG